MENGPLRGIGDRVFFSLCPAGPGWLPCAYKLNLFFQNAPWSWIFLKPAFFAFMTLCSCVPAQSDAPSMPAAEEGKASETALCPARDGAIFLTPVQAFSERQASSRP